MIDQIEAQNLGDDLARALGEGYQKADVIMIADYYDPIQLCELVRR